MIGFVFPTIFTFAVDEYGGETTRAMKVDIGDKEIPVKGTDGLGVALFNVTVAHVFTDDAAILAFDESIVVGSTRTGLGLFDEEFVEEIGDDGIDELAAVVGVEPFEDERE